MRRRARGTLFVTAVAAGLLGLAAQAPTPMTLAAVEKALDAAAPGITAMSAEAERVDYTALMQSSDSSRGRFYFKRSNQGPMYALDITTPKDAATRMVFRDQTVWNYTPASKEVDRYDLGARQDLVGQFLGLGVGGTSAELERSFNVSLAGMETLEGAATAHLALTPRHPEVTRNITTVDVWYDTRNWVAVQLRINYVGGDYHLVRYSKIQVNPKLNDKIFSTDFPGAKVIPYTG